MLKVGLIGVGGISGAHIPAWEAMEDAELTALCDIRPEQMDRYPDKRHYTDFDDMLAHETIDILDICLPTYLHTAHVVMAMKKGANVFVEKPIFLSILISLLSDNITLSILNSAPSNGVLTAALAFAS